MDGNLKEVKTAEGRGGGKRTHVQEVPSFLCIPPPLALGIVMRRRFFFFACPLRAKEEGKEKMNKKRFLNFIFFAAP